MRNHHIAIVINTLRSGGAERFAQLLSRYLVEHGCRVTLIVFTLAHQHYELDARVALVNLDRRGAWDFLRVIWRLRRAIKTYAPDSLLSVMNQVTIPTVLALLFLRKRPRHFARECMYYSTVLTGWRKRLYACLFSIFLPRCERVICQADAMRQDLRDNFGVPDRCMQVIPNPVDIEHCRALGREALAHAFFDRHDQPVIVMCAKLCEQKDYPTLLRAMAQVCQQRPCRLIALGEGPMKAELLALRDELGLTAAVDFVGVVANPYAYMARADVFVLSSHFEGFPNVVLEAMACGAPVICTDCPSGPNEIISQRETGLLVPPRDPAAMAAAILEMLNQPALRATCVRAAAEKIGRHYAIEKIMDAYLHLLLDPPNQTEYD